MLLSRPVSALLLVGSFFLVASSALGEEKRKIWLPGATGSGPYDVARAWATSFSAIYPEARITMSSVGSGASQEAMWGDIDCRARPIKAVCADDTRDDTIWGMGDAPIKSSIYDEQPDIQLQQFPACSGAVSIVYSNEITQYSSRPLRMTFNILSAIFNSTIEYWDDPFIQAANPAFRLPHQLISVVVRSDASGQTSIVTDALDYHIPSWPDDAVGQSPEWPLGNISQSSDLVPKCVAEDEEVATAFKGDGKTGVSLGMMRFPYSIGYMETGTATQLSEFLSEFEFGREGYADSFVGPNADSLRITMDGLSDQLDKETLEANLARAEIPTGGYPISGYAYWYLKRNHSTYTDCYQAWLVCKFVEWSYTDPLAAELAIANEWVVPPQSVVELALERLQHVTCLDTEKQPPVVRSALSYTPPPYRIEKEVDVVLISTVSAATFIVLVLLFTRQRRRHNDHIWKVNKKELIFSEPPEVIGRGSFGLVLLAEYRGTKVAVKRVLPPKLKSKIGRRGSSVANPIFNTDSQAENHAGNGVDSKDTLGSSSSPGMTSIEKATSVLILSNGEKAVFATAKVVTAPLTFFKSNARGSIGGSTKAYNKEAFIQEMRILAQLRHPCITTVMGAVLNIGQEPMLIMEHMDHGSLYDILHNDTMVLDEDIFIPILQDVAQGIRFLHAGSPQVVHGDLKAKNVLVDRKFRAKVADFGLSHRGIGHACGTPYFMAPELLAGKSTNNPSTDVYAFGMLLYETFSRKDPYDHDHEVMEIVLREVMDPEINKRPAAPSNMPPGVSILMKECFDADPSLRPSAEELDSRIKRVDADKLASRGGISTQNMPLKVKNSNLSLFDIFPRHVAEALRDGRTVEPEHKECITLFFSDIIGFTELSSRLDPRKVAGLLDRLYNVFDDLSTKYDVFKVETIGDSYMACTNLVKDQSDDHTKRIAMFSVEAVQQANTTMIDEDDPSLGYVNIRVGFHSGPVVADVVGNRNPRYCLFGDTVNTASRMESCSERNRIQCSKRSRDLLRRQMPEIPLSLRGRINVKGKGDMITYWVNDKQDMSEAAPPLKNVPALERKPSVERHISSGTKMSLSSHEQAARAKRPSATASSSDEAAKKGIKSAPRTAMKRWLAQNGQYPMSALKGDNMV